MLAPSQNVSPADHAPTPADWSPEQETALLLDLCEAQMEAAMRDSDKSVDHLVNAFTELVEASQSMTNLVRQLPQGAAGANAQEINQRCQALGSQINEAIVAFQFYDKLSQRLGHVRHSLTT